MGVSDQSKERNELLKDIQFSFTTLKAAVSNLTVGEGIEACELIVEKSYEIGSLQLDKISKYIEQLRPLMSKDVKLTFGGKPQGEKQ